MDGTGYSKLQFRLDETFGDGTASQIGLELEEEKVVAKQRPQILDALFANMKEEDEVYEPENESWNQHKNTLQQGNNREEQGHVVVLAAILATLPIEDGLLRGAQVPMQNAIFSILFGL